MRWNVHDKLPNTPLLKVLKHFAKSRRLGVAIYAVAQANSQLDVAYGAIHGRATKGAGV